MKTIKKILYFLIALIGLIGFSNVTFAQCVKKVNQKEPFYKLIEPTKTFVDEYTDISPDAVKFVKLLGDKMVLIGDGDKQLLYLGIKFSDFSEETETKDIISSFKVKNSKVFSEMKVIYRLREGCYDCRVELYNKNEVLIMKFFSDKVEEI